jgi:hypothetical protein
VGNVVQLWNPRIDHRLGRHWIRFEDPIVVGGTLPEQSGVLTVTPLGDDRLRARLQVIGGEYEEIITPGNDIALWINGLYMLVGVTAVEEGRALVAFGVPRGSLANVTLDEDEAPMDLAILPTFQSPAGLREMRN